MQILINPQNSVSKLNGKTKNLCKHAHSNSTPKSIINSKSNLLVFKLCCYKGIIFQGYE
nr:MAG TPA: hypothetical protein [Caudoviricetes sp.]